jgi:chitinase
VSADKLVLGFPGFGRTWTLEDMTDTDVGASALGPGYPGPYSVTPGILNYNEVGKAKFYL